MRACRVVHRLGRQLHGEQGPVLGPVAGAGVSPRGGVENVRDYKAPRRPAVLMVLEGSARIGGIPLPTGSTALVPATSEATLAAEEDTRILVTVVKGGRTAAPDLAQT